MKRMILTLADLAAHFGAAPTLVALNERFRSEGRSDCQIALRGTDGSWVELGYDEDVRKGFELSSFDLQHIVEDEIGYERRVQVPLSPGELERAIRDFLEMVEYLSGAHDEAEEQAPMHRSHITDDQWLQLGVLLHYAAHGVAERARELLGTGLAESEARARLAVLQRDALRSTLVAAHQEFGTPREFVEADQRRIVTTYTLRLKDAGFRMTDAIEHGFLAELDI